MLNHLAQFESIPPKLLLLFRVTIVKSGPYPGHGGPSKQIWDSMICARFQPEVSVLTTPAKIELAVTCATFPVRNIGGSAWLKDSERHIALLPTRHPTDQRADHLDHTPCSPHLMAHCRFCPSSLAWGVDDRSLHHAAVTDLTPSTAITISLLLLT